MDAKHTSPPGFAALAEAQPFPSAKQIAGARVLVVGDAMLDRYLIGTVDRISPEAPVPVVHVTRETERLGGAANVALNVKTLGARPTLMTVVGEDAGADSLRRLLAQEGIEAQLGSDASLQTIVKLRVIGRSQQLLRIDFESEPPHEVLGRMLERFCATVSGHDAVIFSDYGKGGLTHIPRMIEAARAAGKPVLVDPKGCDWLRYSGASVITPNRAELTQVIGAWDREIRLQEQAQALRQKLAIDSLLLTRSDEGMSVFDAAGAAHVSAQAREVFDVTGAGDTVIATMGMLMACGMSVRDAMPWANKAGGIVVGKFGTASISAAELMA